MHAFWLAFVPLFVAVDAIGVLPFYVSLTERLPAAQRRAAMIQSLLTALGVTLFFLLGGPWLLKRLGVTVPDFMAGGGIVLLAFSLADLLGKYNVGPGKHADTVGAVPIGVPLLCGPAVLTSLALLANAHGVVITGAALLANMAIAGMVFGCADALIRWLGHTGARTVGKISSILLAAFAVMLIRRGIVETVCAVAL